MSAVTPRTLAAVWLAACAFLATLDLSAQEKAKPGAVALCTAAYRAEQVPGAVTVFAAGSHPTSGYRVFFEVHRLDVFPPEFCLCHVEPADLGADVTTPFLVSLRFRAWSRIERVIVHDAEGRHEVAVEQILEQK